MATKSSIQLPFIEHRKLFGLLLFIVAADLGYSFLQHRSIPMDGDLGAICMPNIYYQRVMDDPLGLAVLLDGESYLATNRFVAHYSIYTYFKYGPKFWQLFFSPIEAIYWNAAFFKIIVQIILLVMLGKYLRVFYEPRESNLALLWYLFLLIPFFQTKGFNHWMGVIDPSITYTFFYSWPMSLLLLFYYPFLKRHFTPSAWPIWLKAGLLVLGFCLPFAGPILPPVIILICGLYILAQATTYFSKSAINLSGISHFINSIDRFTLIAFSWVVICSAYSFYIGLFNSDNATMLMGIGQRYGKLVMGIVKMLSDNLGLALLVAMLIANTFMLKRFPKNGPKQRILKLLFWLFVFIIIYIVLLPLGGFRPYRPYIIRRDTLLPVTLSLLLMYGSTTFFLLNHLTKKYQNYYLGLILALFVIYTIADAPKFNASKRERKGLEKMATSNQKVVILEEDQLVFAWDNLPDTTASIWNAQLIHRLGVTDTVRLYYNIE